MIITIFEKTKLTTHKFLFIKAIYCGIILTVLLIGTFLSHILLLYTQANSQNLPDLQSKVFLNPPNAKNGDTVTITVIITNDSSIAVATDFWTGIYLNPIPTPQPGNSCSTVSNLPSPNKLSWVVNGLAPHASVTLISLPHDKVTYPNMIGYNDALFTNWSNKLPNQITDIYSYVDCNSDKPQGVISENNELNNSSHLHYFNGHYSRPQYSYLPEILKNYTPPTPIPTPTATPIPFVPQVKLVKTTNITTAIYADTIIYSYLISNTGNATLTNLALYDDKLGVIPIINTLLVSENTTITRAHSILGENIPELIENTAIVSATFEDKTVTDVSTARVTVLTTTLLINAVDTGIITKLEVNDLNGKRVHVCQDIPIPANAQKHNCGVLPQSNGYNFIADTENCSTITGNITDSRFTQPVAIVNAFCKANN